VQLLVLILSVFGISPTVHQIMSAEKKEMVPVTRDYTINLHKACHKVYVIVLSVELLIVFIRLCSSSEY